MFYRFLSRYVSRFSLLSCEIITAEIVGAFQLTKRIVAMNFKKWTRWRSGEPLDPRQPATFTARAVGLFWYRESEPFSLCTRRGSNPRP